MARANTPSSSRHHKPTPATLAPSKIALLITLALPQLINSSQAQTAPASKDKELPAIKVQAQPDSSNDYAPGVSNIGGKGVNAVRDIPQSLSVVNRAVLEAQGAASLQEALRNVPGITIGGAEGGQIGNNINLRGFGARTDIYVDGARDRGQYYRDTYYLESVEVLKGPASMLFGRGGTGGVINQARKQANLKDSNEVSASISSSGSLRSTGDFNRKLSNDAALRVSVMAQNSESSRDVLKNRDVGIAPTLRLGIGSSTEITLSALLAHNNDMPDYGLPFVNGQPVKVDRDTFYGLLDDRTTQDVGSLALHIEHKLNSNWSLRSHTQLASYRTDARESSASRVGTLSAGRFVALTSTGNSTSLPLTDLVSGLGSHDRSIKDRSINTQLDLVGKFTTGSVQHNLTAGLELGHDRFDSQASSRSNLPIVPLLNPQYVATPANSVSTPGNVSRATADSSAIYLNDNLSLNQQWKLVAGLRHDRFKADLRNTISTSTPPLYAAAQTVSFTSARGGVIFQPDEAQSYYLSYGDAFNPSLETLSLSSGLQNVGPEKTRSWELGGKFDALDGQLSLNAAWFDTLKTNARSQISPGVYQLDGKVHVKGIELGVVGRITRAWQIMAGFTHLTGQIEEASPLDGTAGKQIANTPKNSTSLWSSYQINKQWEVGGGLSGLSQRFANNTNTLSVPGYVRWDATVAWHQPAYDVRLNLLNLSDKAYFEGLTGSRAVPAAGRTAQLTLAYRF